MKLIIILGAVSVLMLGIIALILFFIGASKKERYEDDIVFIEMAVKGWIVNDNNYRILTEMFENVWRNNCDPARTAKVYARFKKKYKEFSPYILADKVYQN